MFLNDFANFLYVGYAANIFPVLSIERINKKQPETLAISKTRQEITPLKTCFNVRSRFSKKTLFHRQTVEHSSNITGLCLFAEHLFLEFLLKSFW